MKRIVGIRRHEDAVREGVEMLIERARTLLKGSSKPEVIEVALPKPLIEKVVNASGPERQDDDELEDPDETGPTELNFRDVFKARALGRAVPTQITWPLVWDDRFRPSNKVRATDRKVQDPATRAWNLLNALFYKAGKVPWRLPSAEYATSYLGIGFYRDLDGHRLWTSTAQMFDKRGRGLILRGARARTDRPGKHPYLTREDAYDLVKRSLVAYHSHHRNMPARLVIMKTARFEKGEVDGFAEADRRDAGVHDRYGLDFRWQPRLAAAGGGLSAASRQLRRHRGQRPALHPGQRALLRHLPRDPRSDAASASPLRM